MCIETWCLESSAQGLRRTRILDSPERYAAAPTGMIGRTKVLDSSDQAGHFFHGQKEAANSVLGWEQLNDLRRAQGVIHRRT